MSKNTNVFLREDDGDRTLYYDMILIETTRPIFFTCRDTMNDMYICCCYRADGKKCEWVVAPTTPERVIDVLTDQMTIREIFTFQNEDALLVTLYAGQQTPTIQKLKTDDIPGEILPTAGYTIEAEAGEFADEIAELRERSSSSLSFRYVAESFFATSQNFCVKIALPVIELFKMSGGKKNRQVLSFTAQMGGQKE